MTTIIKPNLFVMIFILLSIKTRIETTRTKKGIIDISSEFLSYYPLKQGLKPEISQSMRSSGSNFYPTIH